MKKRIAQHRIKYKFKYRKKQNKNFKKNKLLKPIILILLIPSYIILYPLDLIKPPPIVLNLTEAFNEILSYEKNHTYSINTFYEFRKINRQNKLIDENSKFKKQRKPDITVIMTVHNQAYCLHKCLRSIQNQSLKNLEIIIIDDCSLDNSTEIIKEYKKEDPRIFFIEHDANEGTIKSRTDGIRKAKGKYITIIDGDDAFIHRDILKDCFYIAQRANLDVVEFQKYIYSSGKFNIRVTKFPDTNLQHIIFQPELRNKFIFINSKYHYYLRNRQIWGKFIKNELFQKALNYIGKDYTEDYINFAEDTIMAIGIYHMANSYYLAKEIGYLYSFDPKLKDFPKLSNKVCKFTDKIKGFDSMKYSKFLVEKAGNNTKEQILAYKGIMNANFDYYLNNSKLETRHYEIMFFILDNALEFSFLNKGQKNDLILLKNKVNERKRKDNFI